MNGLLLDTHVAIWWLTDPDRLTEQERRALSAPEGDIWLSAASLWKMAIKKSIGQLAYPATLLEALGLDGIEVLPVTAHHVLAVADMPMLHRDPFDRLLVAQARLEGLTVVTRDAQIAAYGVATLGK